MRQQAVLLIALLLFPFGLSVAQTGPVSTKGRILAVDWSQRARFFVVGAGQQAGSIRMLKGMYQVVLDDFPIGTEWRVLQMSGRTKTSREVIDIVDIRSKIGDVAMPYPVASDLLVDPEATLILTRPDGASLQVKLPPQPPGPLQMLLGDVRRGPVLFSDEVNEKRRLRSVALLLEDGVRVVGAAGRVRDLVAIGVIERLPAQGTKTCTGYVKAPIFGAPAPDAAPAPDIELDLLPTEVVLYRRQSGEVVARSTFPPEPSCPQRLTTFGDKRRPVSPVPVGAVLDWLSTYLER